MLYKVADAAVFQVGTSRLASQAVKYYRIVCYTTQNLQGAIHCTVMLYQQAFTDLALPRLVTWQLNDMTHMYINLQGTARLSVIKSVASLAYIRCKHEWWRKYRS